MATCTRVRMHARAQARTYTQPAFQKFVTVLEPHFWSAIHEGHHTSLNVDNVSQSVALPTDLQYGE
jgi:hypothetical protein